MNMQTIINKLFSFKSNQAKVNVYGTPNFAIISGKNTCAQTRVFSHIEIAYLAKQVSFAFMANVDELRERFSRVIVSAAFELSHLIEPIHWDERDFLEFYDIQSPSIKEYVNESFNRVSPVDCEKIARIIAFYCDYKADRFLGVDEEKLNSTLGPYIDSFIEIIKIAICKSDLFLEQFSVKERATTPESERMHCV